MKIFSNMFVSVQKLGKSLMLPIAVLPVAAIFLRLGVWLDLSILTQAGSAVFGNLALIFGIGVAVGIAKDGHGAAALAGAIAHFTILEGAKAMQVIVQGAEAAGQNEINMGVFSGIIGGITAGMLYNKFHNIKLPDFLGFFAGRRFVPIITGLVSILIAVVLGFIWPTFQNALASMSTAMAASGGVGLFFYGTLNRLLIPTGLHHVINTFFWFQHGAFTAIDGVVSNGDLTRFFAGDPTAGDFMAGFFPIMMFALPAAALAMYVMAKKDKKAIAGGILFSMAFTSFLTGITEPIEFSFMFLAPVLYLIHGLLTGLSLAISHIVGLKLGFGFSAGLIDYVLNFNLATKPLWGIVLGLIFGVVYFFLFLFVIKKFNLKTIGREDDEDEVVAGDISMDIQVLITALGGLSNLVEVGSCVTRLRLTLEDSSKVDEKALKQLGSKGVIKPTANTFQAIFGQDSEGYADQINAILLKK